jgi:uncharacterized protein YdcH (DUF465 family)
MPVTTHEIRQFLLEKDVEFKRLAEEHSRCESQLEQLLKQSYMSAEDLTLETVLKKLKLRLKDQMEIMIARRQQSDLMS